jgi:carboxylesterase
MDDQRPAIPAGAPGAAPHQPATRPVAASSHARLILFPGLLSTPREFGMITHALNVADVRHTALAVPGYSGADPRRPQRWQQWVAAAGQALEHATLAESGPVVLGGLCVGGMLAAALAAQRTQRVAGLVMLSPTFVFDGWAMTPWLRWRHVAYALHVQRWIRFAEREPYGVKNERIRAWIAREMRGHRDSAAGPARLPLWALHESEKLTRHVRDALARLQCPMLVLHAREDEITRYASVARVLAGARPRELTLVPLSNSYHMVTMDNDRHRVVAELARFLRRFERRTPPSFEEPRPAWTTPCLPCAA